MCCRTSLVIDCGTAEGIFTLSVIDRASKVYCIECDPLWMEALEMTLQPYRDKVIVLNKFASDSDKDGQITIYKSIY
jgi:16S rRNA A1518/A1519 N6-dimethyltransferase RsmA/KsgA/DIM1 with predicted DNA glycosylase/AP lyase activity